MNPLTAPKRWVCQEGWASPQANEGNTADRDKDGIPERMVKFDRSAVQAVLKSGVTTVTVMGKLPNHTTLHATDVLKVIGKGGKTRGPFSLCGVRPHFSLLYQTSSASCYFDARSVFRMLSIEK